jgi:glyoxylase-like metal-dependent hydrolase (beta-lactamase superfamily II)
MTLVAKFTFNPFEENTYILYDDTKECVIIDPGCYHENEKLELIGFIEQENLKPVRLINTHCHIDHIFGNHFIIEKYNLELEIHEGELPVLNAVPQVAMMYGIPFSDPVPVVEKFIKEGDIIKFGNSSMESIFTPGHSPASLSFYCNEADFIIAGDVLFYGSIGRTDLPGGDYNTLISSIKDKLFPLGDNIEVYPGHGPKTTIGYEKKTNPFLQD